MDMTDKPLAFGCFSVSFKIRETGPGFRFHPHLAMKKSTGPGAARSMEILQEAMRISMLPWITFLGTSWLFLYCS